MEKINLYERRDFGANFNTTFKFLKQNYGAICKTLCYFIPVFLIMIFFIKTPIGLLGDERATVAYYTNPYYLAMMLLSYAVYMVISLIVNTYVICYMAEYTKPEKISNKKVWNRVGKNILPLLLCAIIYSIVVTFATGFCIIPGIIVGVYWIFFAYTYIIQDDGITGCFSSSYYLVKENWWVTLGYLLIFGIGVSIVMYIFVIPMYMSAIGQIFQIPFFMSDTYSYISMLIYSMAFLFLMPIMSVALGVMYFSLHTDVYGVDIESIIDQIGTSRPDDETMA